MFAHATSRRKLLWMVFVAIVIVILVPMLLAAKPPAPRPPLGTWNGTTDNGRVVTLILTEDRGFYLEGTTTEPVTGAWTFEALPEGAGVLRCEPADWPNHPIMIYRVTWVGANRIELSNFYFNAVLHRMT
jgi:hypothetical protein